MQKVQINMLIAQKLTTIERKSDFLFEATSLQRPLCLAEDVAACLVQKISILIAE